MGVMSLSLRKYLKDCNKVCHTTLDPKGPGVVRIHLVPPKNVKPGIPWVVVLNGYSVLPLQTTWAILLKEFIEVLNERDGEELSDVQIDIIIKETCDRVKKVFPKAQPADIRGDLADIVETLKDIALGKEPSMDIGYMTLSDYSKYMSAPHRMDLMISSMKKDDYFNCNQRCLHCYACGEKMAEVEELSTEDWKKVIDKCRDACIPSITFTGGEPTMRDDLVELVSYSRWFVTRLNTNGILLSKELCANLYAADLDSVQVTLYSYDEQIHNTLVGVNKYKQTIEGIKNALEEGLDVSINTPLCSINSNYVDTVKAMAKLGVKYFSCSGLIPTGNANNHDSRITRLSKSEILKVVKEAYQYAKDNDLEISFTSPGWIDEIELKKMQMVVPSCGACLSNMAVAPNGDVLPCQSWLFENVLDNILKTNWKSIWNSKNCKEYRKLAVKTTQKCLLRKEDDIL